MELRGYSERGVLNALFFELHHSGHGTGWLAELLGICKFPGKDGNPRSRDARSRRFEKIKNARVRIEQSFSDFGDADALILLDGADRQRSVFVEAKVKTYQDNWGSISAEWSRFEEMLHGGGLVGVGRGRRSRRRSNLFVQLYRKQQLVRKLQNEDLLPDPIAARWSLGDNVVVRRAADELRLYCGEPWFLALVPDPPERLEAFFRTLPPQPHAALLPHLRTDRWGFLSWKEMEDFCGSEVNGRPRLPETLLTFKYNRGQIYGGAPLVAPTARGWPEGIPSAGVSMVRLTAPFHDGVGSGFPDPPDTFVHFSWNDDSAYLRNYYRLPFAERWFRATEVRKHIRLSAQGQKEEVPYPRNRRRSYRDESWWRDETHRLNQEIPPGGG